MSDKGKARRAAYEARQEKEGKKIIKWIFIALVALAVCFVAYSVYLMS